MTARLETNILVPMSVRVLLRRFDHQVPIEFADFIAMHIEIRDTTIHAQLQHDLVTHLWGLKEEHHLRRRLDLAQLLFV
jgi:hypothetical protein